eukprot:1141062-Pelagomonas_calceolata.AAC.1
MARLVEGMDIHCVVTVTLVAGHQPQIFAVFNFYQVDMAVLDVQFKKLPGWSCIASYFFITSHIAEHPM